MKKVCPGNSLKKKDWNSVENSAFREIAKVFAARNLQPQLVETDLSYRLRWHGHTNYNVRDGPDHQYAQARADRPISLKRKMPIKSALRYFLSDF
ncbi:hypothetical protein [Aequorivita echinoideorum]|uniref:Uncharacterized protein n=1 Tax=Aequorivita echinoideorum TaxID=1549647 RepID=A0ABS5S4Q7_9FLAO|nr:hypothetical protein [Aequorivita echinoideorum]MBT0607379.1 hypothetical protein [Aequorivita echinoideorum]